MQSVAIIGGGITGLAAAARLARAKADGCPIDYVLLEKDDRLGGKILTERADGFTIDGGPDCFLSEKPWVKEFAIELGVDGDIIPSNDAMRRTFILTGGRMNLLPDGTIMMVPTKFMPFATTGLFTMRGKLRMGMDLVIPRRKDEGDETLASFVTRRLGRECLDRLAEPLVGGIHASDPEEMSLQATFPRFLDMEQKYGSLIRGFAASRRKMPKPPPVAPGAPKRTFFMSFKEGMQELTDAAADAAGRDRLMTGIAVGGIEKAADGRYRLTFEDGREPLVVDAVIVATEAWAASKLVDGADPDMADVLATIPHSSSATVSLAFKKDELGHTLDAFGFVVPQIEGRKIMASTFSSTKWDHRTVEGQVLLRAFVGGPHSQHLLDQSDEDMVRMVRDELADILGIKAEPTLFRVYRWIKGMPQYTLGHLERLAVLDRRQEADPGLLLAGGSYRGVGIGDCINSGRQAADKTVACLASRR